MALNKKEVDMFAYPELFREVKRQAMRQLALDDATSLMLCSELCRALSCKASHPDPMSLSLPPMLDHAWHYAILNTREYARFCQENFRQFLDHTTVTDEDSDGVKQQRIERLMELYRTTYGREPNRLLWHFDREADDTSPGDMAKRRDIDTFQIFVRTLDGKIVTLDVSQHSTILELKRRIEIIVGSPSDQQRLLFAGQQLEDGRTLDNYAIGRESTIHLVMRMRGC